MEDRVVVAWSWAGGGRRTGCKTSGRVWWLAMSPTTQPSLLSVAVLGKCHWTPAGYYRAGDVDE